MLSGAGLSSFSKFRDCNRIGNDSYAERFRTRLIPTPAPPAAAEGQDEEEDEDDGDGAMRTGPKTRSLQPRRRRPGKVAEQKRKETFKHKGIRYCSEYALRSEVLSTICNNLRGL